MLSSFKIGNKVIGEGRTFVIADIGSNHNNDLYTAQLLVDASFNAGVDAVKFQVLEPLSLGKRDWHEQVFDYCKKKDILWFASTNSLKGIDFLEENNVKLHKIASPQTALSREHVLKIAKTGKPIVMSTGYCNHKTIWDRVHLIQKYNDKLALLHCVSEYPTSPEIVNLRVIQKLKEEFHIPVGFSDHTLGWVITLSAVSIGADIIEKHITLNTTQHGLDHHFALLPFKFAYMVHNIHIIEKALGDGIKKVTPKEKETLQAIKEKQ